MKAVLGLKLDPWHDTGAAVVLDDGSRLRVVAISQERLDRIKHSRAFPAEAITYCLETAGCTLKDLSLVVSDFIVSPTVDDRATWVEQPAPDEKQNFFREINNLGIPAVFAEHHVCHAASAYYATDWADAAALVIDGLGSHYETQSIFNCSGNGITKVATSRKPGIGLMYNAVTELLLGFEHLQEGKTMGLAGHAKNGGKWAEYFRGKTDAYNPCQIIYDQFVEKEPALKLTAPAHLPKRKPADDPVSGPFPQYAYAAQSSLESSVLHMVRATARMLPAKRLCYSGGVALNIPANRMILDSGLYDDLFIQPAASDSGIPLGAALLGYYSILGGAKRWSMEHAFLGRNYDLKQTGTASTAWRGPSGEYSTQNVARLLANDYLVAWVQGPSEYGPRALGHRSILCLPRDPQMKAYLNREVKHREMFRPFAPIVPVEEQGNFFDLSVQSPFMLLNATVHPDKAALIPAIVHADGTARVQSIRRSEQPELHALLQEIGTATGVPILLNTSLNLAGEPIVETPAEAIDLFKRSRLDALVLGQHLLTKKPLQELFSAKNPGLAAMHASASITATTPNMETSRENKGPQAQPQKDSPGFNILFYVDPLLDDQKEAFIRGCHFLSTTVMNALKNNPQVQWNALILGSAPVREMFGEEYRECFREIDENLFLDYYKGAGRYEVLAKSFRGEHKKEALAHFAGQLKTIIGDFKPDVIFSSVPVPFLKVLFPSALTIYAEAGLMTTFPIFYSLLFDPAGLLSSSFIEQFAPSILGSSISDAQRTTLQHLRQKLREVLSLDNPFQEELAELKKKYRKLVLLSLPFIIDLHNDPGIESHTVEELLFSILEKIDKDTGVLISTHPHEKMMSAELVDKVQEAFPNATYLAKKHHYFTSIHIIPSVDAVINVSSKTALWSLLLDKKLLSIGKTFSAVSDWESIEDFNADRNERSIDKDPLLLYLLTHYYVPEKYYTDGAWMTAFIQKSICRNVSGNIGPDFYDDIDGDMAILEDLIRRTEGYLEDRKKTALEFTGERFVPELSGQIAYEHFHRYAFASEFAKNKRVLDIASGEGYGSALLAAAAREVVGVDISNQAVNHAREKYKGVGNLSFIQGECKKVPCPDGSFDVVVSFETLEHTRDQAEFLSEIKRVLVKDGILVISTPNKKIYSDDRNYDNPYHVLELDKDDFNVLLNSHFTRTSLWGQRVAFSSHLWPMDSSKTLPFRHYRRPGEGKYSSGNEPPFDPEYYIAVCSDSTAVPDNYISLYTGEKNELFAEYANRETWARALEKEVAAKNDIISNLRQQINQFQKDGDGTQIEEEKTAPESTETGAAAVNDDSESEYVFAQTLVQNGRIDEALAALNHIVQNHPDHADAHAALGALYARRQDKVRALMHYERAVTLAPQNTGALRALADLYYVDMGRTEDAQILYCRCIAQQPDDCEILQILANICVSQKQFNAARTVFAAMQRLAPENNDAKNAIAAIDRYQSSVVATSSPEFLHKESGILAQAGLYREAISLLERLIGMHPEFVLAYNDLGVLYGNSGDFPKAQQHYQEALKLEPENIMIQKNLADLLLVGFGNAEEAVKLYSAILQHVPDDQEALLALRQARAERDDSEQAITDDFSVTLVQCPAWGRETPPVAISLLAGNLRSKGYRVHLFDLNNELYHQVAPKHKMYWDQEQYSFWSSPVEVKNLIKQYQSVIENMVDRIVEKKSRLIGFSIVFTALHFTLEIAERVKKRLPDSIIVLGGPSTAEYADGLKHLDNPFVDALVLREGDITLPELCKNLKETGRLLRIPGLVFKENGSIINGGLRDPAPSLDDIPYADYSDFDLSTYTHPNRLDMFSSRSCVNQCHYCDERKYLQRYRFRSGKSLFEEVRYNLQKFPGITYINFCDSVVNGSLKELSEFARLLVENSVHITWSGQSVVRKDMTPDLLKLLAKSGCTYLSYGVETGSDAVLKSMNKKLASREAAENNLRDTHNAGIKAYANFMFGYPTETEEDFRQTLDFVRKNRPWIDGVSPSQSFTVIVPNTYLYENPGQFGVEDSPHYLYWSTRDGKNTYPVRFERYERFCTTCIELGLVGVGIVKEKVDKWKLLGSYYRFKQDYERAAECYQKDLLKHGYSADSLTALLECYRKGEKFNPSEPMLGMERLISFYNASIRDLADKIEEPDTARSLQHKDKSSSGEISPDASTQLAHASALSRAQAGDEAGAIKDLECAVASCPGYAVARNDLGVLLQRKGDFAAARSQFEEAVRLQPENVIFQKNLADLHVVLKNFEDAARLYDRVINQSPDDIEALSGLSRLCLEIEQFDSARRFLERILEINPDDQDARQCLDALTAREKTDAAPPSGASNASTESAGICADKIQDTHSSTVVPPATRQGNSVAAPAVTGVGGKQTPSPERNGIICLNPFFEFEIDITGRVVVCCTGWFRHSLGNMKKQTIAEVWNSQVARYVRRKMYKGEWEDICNPHCPTIVHYRKYGTVIPYSELHKNKNLTPKHVEEILAGKDCLESTPTYFKLSDSKVCNLSCKMCGVVRSKDYTDDKAMIQKRTKDLMQYLDRAKTVLMCGNGDPFARPDTREILMHYKSNNPDLKFCLITNGLLLPRYWDKVKHQNFESIDISVDGASKDVYEKIRTGGKWEDILKVLDLVRDNRSKFGNVLVSMVVMRSNFREIPAFIDMAESYGFLPMFSRIQGQFEDENIFEMRDQAALNELRAIVTAERKKKRSVDVIWQDIIEFADEDVKEEACLVNH